MMKVEVTAIELSALERKYMQGLLSKLNGHFQGPSAMAMAILYKKVKDSTPLQLTKAEAELLMRSVEVAINTGNSVLARTDNLEVRVRAGAVNTAYKAIMEKLKHAEWKEIGIHRHSGNVQGQDEGREQGQNHDVSGSTGSGTASS